VDAIDRSLQRRHRNGDRTARDELVERHLSLARALAMRYRDRGEPVADLTQVAYLGLLKAVDRWDPDRGTAFSSFAVPTILGELRRYFRDKTWMVKTPRDVQELWLRIARARDELWQLGHTPTANDVARHLDVSIEDVNDALMAGAGRAVDSLDEPLNTEPESGLTRLDRIADTRDEFDSADAAVTFAQLSETLDPRAREVLRLRYREDLLQWEIGERVGCSQMHVSRILRDSIATLRERIQGSPDASSGSLVLNDESEERSPHAVG
jgi:RNA polymerase sigma-B factor